VYVHTFVTFTRWTGRGCLIKCMSLSCEQKNVLQWAFMIWYDIRYDSIYIYYDIIGYIFLTAIGLTPGGSSTVRIYTQIVHRTTQWTQTIHRTTQLTNWEECGLCPVFASYTLAFVLQLRKKHGNNSVRVAEECQLARWKQNIQNRAYVTIRIHKHNNKNT
jgi:hypothetical protein